jgi:hypothetical protein
MQKYMKKAVKHAVSNPQKFWNPILKVSKAATVLS